MAKIGNSYASILVKRPASPRHLVWGSSLFHPSLPGAPDLEGLELLHKDDGYALPGKTAGQVAKILFPALLSSVAPYNDLMADTKLERTLAALPPDLRAEVEDFAAFLLSKQASEDDATGEAHSLASLAGAWRNEPLTDEDLVSYRTFGRDVDL